MNLELLRVPGSPDFAWYIVIGPARIRVSDVGERPAKPTPAAAAAYVRASADPALEEAVFEALGYLLPIYDRLSGALAVAGIDPLTNPRLGRLKTLITNLAGVL